MKAITLAFALMPMLLASPGFGQQPTDKPEMPPWDGAIFANGATRVSARAEAPWGRCDFGRDASDLAI